MSNRNLTKAKNAKNDEFYTRLEDIERELYEYKNHFKGKRILCNCNDPYESNFFKYFVLNFRELGLKSLTSISYSKSDFAGSQWWPENVEKGKAYKMVINFMPDPGDKGFHFEEIKEILKLPENQVVQLEGEGDFRGEESIEELEKAEIVVTNPCFSLFRSYIAQLTTQK